MQIGIVAAGDLKSKKNAKTLEKFIRKRYPDQGLSLDLKQSIPDTLITIGDDRFILDTLRKSKHESKILGVGKGFLSEVSFEHHENWIGKLINNEFSVEERMRLQVDVDDKIVPPVLNEASLSTSKGGGFLYYSLEIDGERIWTDSGDGVIICTPTGSTGYGLSAGGPIVMENAETIVIVPICSASNQHPLVIPRQSEIAITNIESRLARNVVLDGKERVRLKSSGFTIKESKSPARFIHFGKAQYLQVFRKFRTIHSGKTQLSDAPPSAKFIYRLLEDQGPLTEKQLISDSGLPERTVRSAIKELTKRNLIQRIQTLRDTREFLFTISP
jgi:NAD+ kinase